MSSATMEPYNMPVNNIFQLQVDYHNIILCILLLWSKSKLREELITHLFLNMKAAIRSLVFIE